MDRPDLLYPFARVTCPACLADLLRDPIHPTLCPHCDRDTARPVGLVRVADRPPDVNTRPLEPIWPAGNE